MTTPNRILLPALAAALALLAAGAAGAQSNVVKVGALRYTTASQTNGIHGVGVPPGADAETGDATTLLLTYERALTPNIGVELVIGVPPKITAKATGTVAFLGDDVLSAKNVAPTLLMNYYFGDASSTIRPYVGVGLNYTKFASVKSSLAPKVEMSDSLGAAIQAGVNYAITKQYGLFASAARERKLGVRVEGNSAQFKLWAPTAQRVLLCVYERGDGAARARDFARGRVEREVGHLQHGAGAAALAAAQRTQSGEQLVELEGLDEVVVGAGVQPGDAVLHAVARGEDEHRHRAPLAAPLAQPAHAVAAGQAEAEVLIQRGADEMGEVEAGEGEVHVYRFARFAQRRNRLFTRRHEDVALAAVARGPH